MTSDSDLRHEYNVARGYLAALQGCLDHLERLGVDETATGSARFSLNHIAQRLAEGVAVAEAGQDTDAGEAPPAP